MAMHTAIISVALKMKPRNNGIPRTQISKSSQEGPNWIIIVGGALLSTLSIRLGYKLKQLFDTKQSNNTSNCSKGSGKAGEIKKSVNCHLHSNNVYCYTQDEDTCFNCLSGAEGTVVIKQRSHGKLPNEPGMQLPLVTLPATEYTKENGVIWASSSDHLELPQKPFHHSNGSESPCVSESGSDIFSKREVIQKLRQQLKRRDDMILEMKDQIVELQNSLSTQVSHSNHLQSLLDAANRDLFDSETEVQSLRKAIADHCVGRSGPNDISSATFMCQSEGRNGHPNGYPDGENSLVYSEKGRGEMERIEVLKREVSELKEVIEGKDYLLHSYKEQKAELSLKIKEMQLRLDSQLPNIL